MTTLITIKLTPEQVTLASYACRELATRRLQQAVEAGRGEIGTANFEESRKYQALAKEFNTDKIAVVKPTKKG